MVVAYASLHFMSMRTNDVRVANNTSTNAIIVRLKNVPVAMMNTT